MIWLIPILWVANNARLIHADRAKIAKPGRDYSTAGDAYQYSIKNLLTKCVGSLTVGG